MISQQSRTCIKGYLEGFLQGLIDEHKLGGPKALKSYNSLVKDGSLKPFHEAILPKEIRRINEFERSFSTRLGNAFEYCAFYIASQNHSVAQRGYSVPGFKIPAASAQRIEEMKAENNAVGMQHSFLELAREIRDFSSQNVVERPAISDLYFKSANGEEWFFEIKSPKPNKGQCLEVTERLLTIQAIKAPLGGICHTYFAMAYNPYGSRESYNWTYAKKHLDIKIKFFCKRNSGQLLGMIQIHIRSFWLSTRKSEKKKART